MGFELTDRQLDAMNVLWERGSATVREAKEEIDEGLAYTSVLTLFQTLEENGQVRHEQEGRGYRYYPTVSREEAGRRELRHVRRRVFGGSLAALLTAALEEAEASDDAVDESAVPVADPRES